MTTIYSLLETYRSEARTEREKGTYFERLSIAYLSHDPVQAQQYESVQTYAEWAKALGKNAKDIGIDLVAKLRGMDGYAAIQCKFYDIDKRISKADIDSFISASGKEPFRRRVIIDTTTTEWGQNAEEMLRGQSVPVVRINLTDLEESPIRWGIFAAKDKVILTGPKVLRPDQHEALSAVRDGLRNVDRGKLIMACGTGKTLTSLRIAEEVAGLGKSVLFLVPSLALMAQTVREWAADATVPLRAFAVCSDSQVGKRRKNADDVAEIDVLDLAFPATTDAAKLAEQTSHVLADHMTVVFATYQSLAVISDAQNLGLSTFDLMICDEAHRTTGAILAGEVGSNFVKVHDDDFVKGQKRLYMTATPRIFGAGAKSKADEVDADVVSMDNEDLFGPTLFYRGFSWAVREGLLTDYKVIVLAVDESSVSSAIQSRLTDNNSELALDDVTKIVGCYKALTKGDMRIDLASDPEPMRRAIAFCKDINSSKLVCKEFKAVVDEYLRVNDDAKSAPNDREPLRCELDHVDGTFDAKRRGALLDRLRSQPEDDLCRILTNARCLSEGVDVPALDAIMFLHPRKSQIDVIQSVGRVMRKAPGKSTGYVILPVGVPSGMAPEQALRNNDKYRVVWQILNALRAHDEGLDATINQASLGQDVSGKIAVIGVSATKELKAVTAVAKELPTRRRKKQVGLGQGGGSKEHDDEDDTSARHDEQQLEFAITVDDFTRAIMAKIVKKCGTRDYWEDWASNIADIARKHIVRIGSILAKYEPARAAFDTLHKELKSNINPKVSEDDAIELLAQHVITKPVFDAVFKEHDFTGENPVSKAIQQVVDILQASNIGTETASLDDFYDSVRLRANGITDPKAKQQLIKELYEKFFRKAFPRTAERLGIVYTPIEVVDFIIHSVNNLLRKEFGESLGSKGVHIIDPFVGTGTFVTRLLQSGLIPKEDLTRKYKFEIHANEIILLAYYIAAINIESVFAEIDGGPYEPFEGICLTDSFQIDEAVDLTSLYLPINSKRVQRQKSLDIRVIIGNPPYSVGRKKSNDDARNVEYASLRSSLQQTYIKESSSNPRSVYDTYILAIRSASDRLGRSGRGIIGFVTGNGFIDKPAMDGMRRCLQREFSSLYVVNLRGDVRKDMLTKGAAREGGNVFDTGSMNGIAISFLVRNPDAAEQGKIYYHDIGDSLSTTEKRKLIETYGSTQGLTSADAWTAIEPNEQADWIRHRKGSFSDFLPLGDKQGREKQTLFENFSLGVATNRDAWAVNFSPDVVRANMARMIAFYDEEQKRFKISGKKVPDDVIDLDAKKISWSYHLKARFASGKSKPFMADAVKPVLYRPFVRQWMYYDSLFNEYTYQTPKLFGDGSLPNLAIMVSGTGARSGFTALMVNSLVSADLVEKGQCFPLNLYERGSTSDDMFGGTDPAKAFSMRSGISESAMKRFEAAYPGQKLDREDVFFYVYGILHSPEYREEFAVNLDKEIPRIPIVAEADDFAAFVEAGRKMSRLHVDYHDVEPYPVTLEGRRAPDGNAELTAAFYRTKGMSYPKKRIKEDRSRVVYNDELTIADIPETAYGYVVNGKPALEWVMERMSVKVDKASGIANDVNEYARHTMGEPSYPLDLFRKVITVSLETLDIVSRLPKLRTGTDDGHIA